MKMTKILVACALASLSFAASADHWHTGNNYRGHKGKYEYWDGNCKVKREFKKNGRYKEKRDCKPRYSSRHYHHHSRRDNYPNYGVNIPAIIIEPIIRIGR